MVTTIEPKTAIALTVDRGSVLRIIDPEGNQCGDLVAFSAGDTAEHFSQGVTRANNDKATVSVGDHLFSNLNTPMFTVVADTVGVHDMLFMPCSEYLFEHVYGIKGKTGCREHLTSALEEYGIGWERVTEPFNVFMNAGIDGEGRMRVYRAPSKPGDHLDLRAEMDLIVAVSACAADINDGNAGVCTSMAVEVLDNKG